MSRIFNKDQLIQEGATEKYLSDYEKELNVLHKFRTYAYHHILVVANTTAAAEIAINSKRLEDFMHPSMDDKYKPIDLGPAGSYMILINGLTDAEYLIQSVEWECIFDPNASNSNPHASFVEGTMDIIEPAGVRFMNLLKVACDRLETDPNGLTFLLKTVFVGYTDEMDGQGEIAQVLEVKPFQFFIDNITGEFSSTGSTYQIEFVGQVNGTSRLPAFSKVQQSNVSAGTVQGAIDALQKTLNEVAKKSYEDVKEQIKETSRAEGERKPHGRPVEYIIKVHPSFQGMALDNVNARNAGRGGMAQIGTPSGIDIESAISDILYCSTEIVTMMNKNAKEGSKTIFKIESAMESTLDRVTITYVVKRCEVPVLVKDNTQKRGQLVDANIKGRKVIEFDYIFSGQNVEILEFDMKMAMGLVFFQSLTSSNVFPDRFGAGSGNITSMGSGQGTTMNSDPFMRKYAVVPMSASISDPAAQNKVEPSKTADFRTFMARQAALESIESKIRITGIPAFLDVFNHKISDVLNEDMSQKEALPLVKVNVRMPVPENDFKTGGNFTEEFWYTGNFYVISCKNSFKEGRFEQELDLISLMYEELVTPTSSAPNPAKPSAPSTGTTQPSKTPTPVTPKPDKSKAPSVQTSEQQAKAGTKPAGLTPDEILDCQSIRKNGPITMESAKRTKLSETVTLDMLVRRPVNLPHLTDRILNNMCAMAKQIENLQKLLGHRINITSAFRCAAYNAGTKGSSKTSDHMQAVAIDFQCPAAGTPLQIYEKIKASNLDIRQCIYERSGSTEWVHVSFNIDSSLKPISPKFFHLKV